MDLGQEGLEGPWTQSGAWSCDEGREWAAVGMATVEHELGTGEEKGMSSVNKQNWNE